MKYRYLIERGPIKDVLIEDTGGIRFEKRGTVYLTTITREDEDGRGYELPNVEAAKRTAVQDPNADGELRWRDVPKDWQPDAILVSQWLDDGVEEYRDA